ncbi:MAG TPA: FprA family A-type flavoprotein [Spirochaetia bacterium]|nr:FprA family A-type flavoprotein [Spirochaetia bacterium]
MATVEIKPDIYWVGVNDRTTDLFEGIWPITREGVSYNSYLINDEKKVIIDLSKAIKTDIFFDHISEIVALSDIDYVILNHMEPDHTGVLRTLKRMAPKMTILGTPKTKKMLEDFYGITENIREVGDGETLSLGKTQLTFIHAPFVHWPETMVTYETTQKILFSCDAFGGYGALRGTIFDDECGDMDFYLKESLRYYANIVAKFSGPVLKAIEKLSGTPVAIIAPSHGLIWRKDPGRIVDLYKKWAEYATRQTEPAITLVYGSMYGNTEMMMNAVIQGISSTGVPVEIFDAARTHVSYILPALWTNAGVAIGTPTYEVGVFPPVGQVLEMAALKRIMNKKAFMFGSFGWSGGALKKIRDIIDPLKWDLVETYEFAGGPTTEELKRGEKLGADFARTVKAGS